MPAVNSVGGTFDDFRLFILIKMVRGNNSKLRSRSYGIDAHVKCRAIEKGKPSGDGRRRAAGALVRRHRRSCPSSRPPRFLCLIIGMYFCPINTVFFQSCSRRNTGRAATLLNAAGATYVYAQAAWPWRPNACGGPAPFLTTVSRRSLKSASVHSRGVNNMAAQSSCLTTHRHK